MKRSFVIRNDLLLHIKPFCSDVKGKSDEGGKIIDLERYLTCKKE